MVSELDLIHIPVERNYELAAFSLIVKGKLEVPLLRLNSDQAPALQLVSKVEVLKVLKLELSKWSNQKWDARAWSLSHEFDFFKVALDCDRDYLFVVD